MTQAPGLSRISRERVWSEMQLIIAHTQAVSTLQMMHRHGILPQIDLPGADQAWLSHVAQVRDVTENPSAILALTLGLEAFDRLVITWRLSNEQAGLGRFVLTHTKPDSQLTLTRAKEMLTENVKREFVFEAMLVLGLDTSELATWAPPAFPVKGQELMPNFTGVALGQEMRRLRQVWYDAGFSEQAVREAMAALSCHMPR
jgi:tRNA nucleotidyltransferase/poly(A) polymerase